MKNETSLNEMKNYAKEIIENMEELSDNLTGNLFEDLDF